MIYLAWIAGRHCMGNTNWFRDIWYLSRMSMSTSSLSYIPEKIEYFKNSNGKISSLGDIYTKDRRTMEIYLRTIRIRNINFKIFIHLMNSFSSQNQVWRITLRSFSVLISSIFFYTYRYTSWYNKFGLIDLKSFGRYFSSVVSSEEKYHLHYVLFIWSFYLFDLIC